MRPVTAEHRPLAFVQPDPIRVGSVDVDKSLRGGKRGSMRQIAMEEELDDRRPHPV